MTVPPLPRILVPHPHVRSDAHILSGSPHVVGSRVPVRRLWAWHRGGTAVEKLMRRYPQLGPAKVLDALSFAYDNLEVMQADLDREQALFEERGGPTQFARPLSQLALPFAAPPVRSKPSPPHVEIDATKIEPRRAKSARAR